VIGIKLELKAMVKVKTNNQITSANRKYLPDVSTVPLKEKNKVAAVTMVSRVGIKRTSANVFI
jgi:hypothetical protein